MGAHPSSVTSIVGLLDGRWGSWIGLDPMPTVDDLIEVLGPSLDPRAHSGMFAGSPTMFRRCAGHDDAIPATLWFEGDVCVAVQIDDASRSVLDAPLDEPAAVLDSAVGLDWEQRVYADRGLIVHAPRLEPQRIRFAALVIGLPPFDIAGFGSDPVRLLGGASRIVGDEQPS